MPAETVTGEPAVADADGNEREPLEEAAAKLRSGHVRVAHELYAQALASSSEPDVRGAALEGLARVAHASGRPREAARLFQEALDTLGAHVADRLDIAELLGRSYGALGELDRATAIFESCLQRARERDDAPARVRFASLLSFAFTDRGRFEEAERAVAEVVAAGDSIADRVLRARVEWAQARLRGEQGRTEVALRHARRVHELLQPTDEKQFLAVTFEMLASLTNDLGRPDEALDLLRQGWPLLLATATPLQVAHCRIEEARALAALGEHEGAAAVAMRVAAQLDGTHPGDAGRAYVLLGEIFDKLGDVIRSRQLYETGIALLSKQGPSRYLAEAYRRLGELFEAEYRTEDALAVLKRAVSVQARVESAGPPPAA
jgi:tetratricopeptide (TPR) repeat protein